MLISICQRMPSQIIAANIPVNARGTVHDAKFVFSARATRYGMVACDLGKAEGGWLKGALESARRLRSDYNARGVVFVVREMQGAAYHLPGNKIPLIVGSSASDVTNKLLTAFTK